MKLARKAGATSQIFQVFIRDSSSTTGAGLTGLAFGTGSLTAYYHRDTDTTATAITLVTMTVGTFTSSGFKEIDATNMPGWYQVCPPNAAFSSGASSVGIMLKGAANMAPCLLEIDLDAQVDVTFWNGAVVATPATAGIPDVNAKNINNVATTSVTTINANVGTTQPTNFTGTGGSALVKSDTVDLAGQVVTAAAGVTFPTSVASPTNITAGTITNVTNLTNAPTSGDFTATMKTSLNAATPSVTVSDKTGFSLSSAGIQAIWDALTSALTTVGSIGKLLVDNINATISSRSTYAGTDTPGTTTLLDRLTAPRAGYLDNLSAGPVALASGVTVTTNNDKTGYALTAAYDAAKTAAQPGDAMTLTGDFTPTMKTSITTAATAATPTAAAVTGNVGGNVAGSVASVVGLNPALLDVAVSTRLAADDFTTDVNIKYVNDVEVTGDGSEGNEWGPA